MTSQKNDEPLSISRYGEALAHLREYEAIDHPAVLSKLGTNQGAFDRARASWSRRIQEALEQDDVAPLLI